MFSIVVSLQRVIINNLCTGGKLENVVITKISIYSIIVLKLN